MNKENKHCIICGTHGHFFMSKNGHNLYKCTNCGLIFIYPLPNEVESVYDEDYFNSGEKKFGYIEYDRDKLAMKGVFLDYLDLIKQHTKGSMGELLDVGCATGFFVKLANNAGWEGEGIEISPWASAYGVKTGLKIQTGSFENINLPQDKYDIITMLDVFEHSTSPSKTLDKAHASLIKNGLLIINTPDASSLWAKLTGKHWQALVPPEHLYLFNGKNIKRFIKDHGFEVLDIKKIGKKFTLGYIFYILLGRPIFTKSRLMNNISLPLNLRDNIFIIARKTK